MMSVDQLTIGRFSQITRLSEKALRLYDQKGILKPAIKDDLTGYRYYTLHQIDLGIKINYLLWIGFSLSDITRILEASKQGDQTTITNLFSGKKAEIQTEITRLQKIEQLLEGSSTVNEIFMNTTPVIVKNVPKMRVISKREKGTYGKTIGKLIGEIFQQIYSSDNRRAFVTVNGPVICIEHDQEYKEIDADIEIAVPITGRITADDPFDIKNIDECEAISTIYTGPYEGISEGYAVLFNYAASEGMVLNGPARELYLVGPQQKPPEEYTTEIQIPIVKNS